MKPILNIIIMLSIALTSIAQGVAFQDITLKEALDKAAKDNKLVFVDCFIQSCGPCKFMAQNIFPQKEVGDVMNPQFVSIMKDLEVGDGVEIAEKYGVLIFPTFLILNPDGSIYHKIEGGAVREAPKFIDKLNTAMKVGEMKQRYNSGQRSSEFMNEFLTLLQKADFTTLRNVVNEYVPSQTAKQLSEPKTWAIITKSVSSTESPAFRHLFDNRKELASILGKEEVNKCLLSVYSNEFNRLKRSSTDFDKRIKEIKILEKDNCTDAMPLRYAMLFRQIINSKAGNQFNELIKGVNESIKNINIETEKVSVLKELRGIDKFTNHSQQNQLKAILEKAYTGMDSRNIESIKSTIGF